MRRAAGRTLAPAARRLPYEAREAEAPLRLVGAMIARDDEDIVEASIRHNLRVLDALAVVHHGSGDATPRILASLASEGLPLDVSHDDTLAFAAATMAASLAARALAAGADLVIPLGADEFVRLPSRDAFERAVREAGPASPPAIAVQTVIPDADVAGDIVDALRRAKRRRDERPDRRATLTVASTRAAPGAMLPEATAAVARVPVRSVEQYVAKVTVATLARLLAPPNPADGDDDLGEAYAAIVAGRMPTRAELASLVANEGVPRERHVAPGPATWVDDPLVEGIALRYTPSTPVVPIARILAFGERVATRIARTHPGPAAR